MVLIVGSHAAFTRENNSDQHGHGQIQAPFAQVCQVIESFEPWVLQGDNFDTLKVKVGV